MNQANRQEMYWRLSEANPHPTTELNYRNPFELLMAVILSAQATDVAVNKATAALFQAAPDAKAMVALGEEGVIPYIKTIGLYRNKAKFLVQCAQTLLTEYQGEVPATREALEALAGVGRKTANVVLNTAFGQPTIAVDTHIFRVANRTGLAPGATVRAVEDKLMQVTPKQYQQNAHHWLILHGRYVCQARRPRCHECLIADLCDFSHRQDATLTNK